MIIKIAENIEANGPKRKLSGASKQRIESNYVLR
jgi:hypothetical protein